MSAIQPATSWSKFVDPMIGTGGDGHTFPGASMPFGMVQLSPDTARPPARGGYRWCAGYRYEDAYIHGFSHTHFSGTGHSDLGDILVMPTSGAISWSAQDSESGDQGFGSAFRHESEYAQPGYYKVELDAFSIKAELTATTRAGFHRYHFPRGVAARVILDLGHSIYDHEHKVQASHLRRIDDRTWVGWRQTSGWAPQRRVYFRVEFSHPVMSLQTMDRAVPTYRGFGPRGQHLVDQPQVFGQDLVGAFEFGDLHEQPLLVKVAISGVDVAGASLNLASELPNWDFDAIVSYAQNSWDRELGRIEVQASPQELRTFYTSLYHAFLSPNIYMDVDGRYRGADGEVHRSSGPDHYDTFSLWDTFRALHPLLTILRPKRAADMVNSLIDLGEQSPHGLLPIWSFHGNETWCMIGYHAVSVISDAVVKGLAGIDAKRGLRIATKTAENPKYAGLGDYLEHGFVAIDREKEAASKTLEYAYDDWAIAQLARVVGEREVEAKYTSRAQNFRNVFDKKTKLMRARQLNGSFREPFDPNVAAYGGDYTEGNAWQYSWFVPHDVAQLVDMFGGEEAFVARLDHLFETTVDDGHFKEVEDITGLIGQYAHGNEPSHHVAYLYAYAGQPWRTQERVAQILDAMYQDAPDGLSGNDDCGQMSAWYLFSALGFYPVSPGSAQYVFGLPSVDQATLALDNGNRFEIEVHERSPEHRYIAKVELNGKPLSRLFITHEEILHGGVLEFWLAAQPNRAWGRDLADRPYSMSQPRQLSEPSRLDAASTTVVQAVQRR